MARSKKQTQKEVAAQEVAIDKAYDKAVKEGLPEGTIIATPCDTCPGYESCRDCAYWQKQNPKKEEVPMTETIVLYPYSHPETGKGFAFPPNNMKLTVSNGKIVIDQRYTPGGERTVHMQTVWTKKDGTLVIIRTPVDVRISKNGNEYTPAMYFVLNLMAQNHLSRPVWTTEDTDDITLLGRYVDLKDIKNIWKALAIIKKHGATGFNFVQNKGFYNVAEAAPVEADIPNDPDSI